MNISKAGLSRLLITKKSESDCYNAGYDCGKNGVTASNCCFSFFRTPEMTKEWERGKEQAEREKLTETL